jgi:hypothetical protein
MIVAHEKLYIHDYNLRSRLCVCVEIIGIDLLYVSILMV